MVFSGMKKEDGPSAAMEDVHVPSANSLEAELWDIYMGVLSFWRKE